MTSRITIAILLITWTILILGETCAFVVARQALADQMDDALIARAATLLDLKSNPAAPGDALVPADDRYSITFSSGMASGPGARGRNYNEATVVAKYFEEIEGKRYRTVAMHAVADAAATRPGPMNIIYSRPADQFDSLINRLATALLALGVFCGMASGLAALKVSRSALRPLRKTAELIADIDETRLSRRIDESALPMELKPMTRRLNEMLARLETVFTQRKRFLADAAHELRTPTAALLTTLEIALRRERDPKALVEAMEGVLCDARLLRRLIDRLMEHARGDHLVNQTPAEPLDVASLLRDCVSTLGPMAEEKGVQIFTSMPAALVLTIQRDRLQSVMLNLMTNAIEYNRAGGTVRVSCSMEAEGVTLSVEDTGEGIAPEQLPHIFEPFYRGNRARQQDTEHLGLGLFLVQSHVKAMGGRCEVSSAPGQGTMMRIVVQGQPTRGIPATIVPAARAEPALV